jgi:hypothetical protein
VVSTAFGERRAEQVRAQECKSIEAGMARYAAIGNTPGSLVDDVLYQGKGDPVRIAAGLRGSGLDADRLEQGMAESGLDEETRAVLRGLISEGGSVA